MIQKTSPNLLHVPFKNIEDRRAYQKRYEAANRKKIRARQAKRRKEHGEEIAEYQRDWAKSNPELARLHQQRYYLKGYGLTLDQFNEMVAQQGGRCACCGKEPEKKLRVDHDHETGEIRGLLCNDCNLGIGKLGDTLEGVQRAVAYLARQSSGPGADRPMSATLNLYSLTLAHGDATANNNPSLRFVDWKRALQGVPVENPKSERLTIQPGVEALVFDGARVLAVDGTTAFDLALTSLAPDRYRLTNSAGTAPAFRTARAVDLTGIALTLTAQANGSLLIAAGAGTPFAALQAGDEVLIPGPETGDPATVFMPLNEGSWKVLAVGGAGANVTLTRPAGQDALMTSQAATPANADQFQAFSAAGVQVGDKLDISAGFASSAQKTFTVVAVTAKRLDFTSTTPLAAEAGIIPGAAGLKVFSNAKRFLRIEADQECVVRLNGDTGSTVRLDPWTAGDPEQVAEFTKVGPSWSLRILNRSAQALHVNVISAE